jgi:hypothetical protein
MIFVRQDVSIIPKTILDAATKAQQDLEKLTCPEKRREYIKSKSQVWRDFAQYLGEMSHGKCWYSESNDPQSFFDVDHFRPKNEAKRAEKLSDEQGYQWLAFSWENFRYAATKSNRLSTNPDTDDVEGKGSWFPLVEGTPCARWDNRCTTDEKPILIDPISLSDVRLVTVSPNDAKIVPSRFAKGVDIQRVKRSAEIYGLNLPPIKDARLRLMREIHGLVDSLDCLLDSMEDEDFPTGVIKSMKGLQEELRKKTDANSPYSRAARAVLFSRGLAELCAQHEEAA